MAGLQDDVDVYTILAKSYVFVGKKKIKVKKKLGKNKAKWKNLFPADSTAGNQLFFVYKLAKIDTHHKYDDNGNNNIVVNKLQIHTSHY